MITVNNTVKNLFDQSSALEIGAGCTFEYNMNQMVDGITVTNNNGDYTDASGNKPFKKLFPVNSIIKAHRPEGAGIKYGIIGDIAQDSYRDPATTEYLINYRTYYAGADTAYKYFCTQRSGSLDVTVSYPKTILTNKIVIKFEISHSTPPSWVVYTNAGMIASGTSVVPFSSGVYNAGTVTLYYNGTSWSTTEPSIPASPASITSLRVTSPGTSGKHTALIEVAPLWEVRTSDNLVSFSISKESSTGATDILPVGYVSANSLNAEFISYETVREMETYNKTMQFDLNHAYLYKQIKIKPFYKLYHSAGSITDARGTYDKISQGIFYLDNWSISEFGDVSVTALDGAKILQETIAPPILCEKFSAVAIMRRLLDSIGFTNYKFNTMPSDKSIFAPKYWWTDDTKTVWQAIQEICKDSQMSAVFNENNVLEFSSREYVFNINATTNWAFSTTANGSSQPNIIDFSRSDLPSINKIKVLWKGINTSEYINDAQPLWSSGNSYMAASSLEQDLNSTNVSTYDSLGNILIPAYISLAPITNLTQQQQQSMYEYYGYIVVDSEIIEYDAIEFKYQVSGGAWYTQDMTSESDVLKYRGLGLAGASNYQPTGRYRIKSRGAFGTTPASHTVNATNVINSWPGYEVVWQ